MSEKSTHDLNSSRIDVESPPSRPDSVRKNCESVTHTESSEEPDVEDDGEKNIADKSVESIISRLPFELLVSILAQIAIDSPKAFVKTQLVGRLFRIPYDSALLWEPICRSIYPDIHTNLLSVDDYGTYYELFRQCPAIRYNGVYVCMSKYYREGEPEGISWSKPLHEVRYYRYFWLKPDGSCRSLLSNHPPRQMLGLGAPQTAAAGISHRKDSMCGHWVLDRESKTVSMAVDGGRRKCTFHFDMSVASSGGKVHNKLKWIKYWCHEHDSNNVSEFGTANEGSYYFLKCRTD